MEVIILRKNILELGYVNSAYISFREKTITVNKLVKEFGWKQIMLKLFKENIDSDNIEDSSLFKSYKSLIGSEQKENGEFVKAYKINESFAVTLDANIYLFHLFPKGEVYTDIVPWYYADSKKYLGDTWWETDAEILQNLNELSVIEFLSRYKGYI